VFAAPITGYLSATTDQLYERQGYISAVLTGPERIGRNEAHGSDGHGDSTADTHTPTAEKEH
jgi:multicomponent K+:H+ antiporter subunit D